MASYVRTNRLGAKAWPVEITVSGHDHGEVDIMAHFDATGLALRFTREEAIELAMLLVKHAGAADLEKVA
jgi:hypothetical protein